jgi:hypothetical protein
MFETIKKWFGMDIPDIPDVPEMPIPKTLAAFEKVVGQFVFNKFKEHFEEYIKNEYPELDRDAAWEKIEESIDGYVEDVLDDIDNSMDQFYYWIETDCSDFAIDPENFVIYKPGDVKSLPNPYPNGVVAREEVWTGEEDEPWNIDDFQSDPCDGCKTDRGEYECETCVVEKKKKEIKENENKEKLVDWGEVDKAW